MTRQIGIKSLEAWLYRSTTAQPMVTSFATLRQRTVLILRIRDHDGCAGWGEAYCNFPPNGGEHRQALLAELFAPRLVARTFDSPTECFDELTHATRVLALQTGEPGPLAQCIAAIDIALWDLVSRRAQRPLAQMLNEACMTDVSGYSTGLSPQGLGETLKRERGRGHRAFKLKLGFGEEVDLQAMRTARRMETSAPLALDPNQAWSLKDALHMAEQLPAFDPIWLEEPLPADTPLEQWRVLADACEVPLAAGENLYAESAFDSLIESGIFRYIQPDPVKWGGVSGVAKVAQRASAAGQVFCPHYIGSGLGWAACMHLVAAFGCPESLVEVDGNDNPLREPMAQPFPVLVDGRYRLPTGAGLGVQPSLNEIAPFLIRYYDSGTRAM